MNKKDQELIIISKRALKGRPFLKESKSGIDIKARLGQISLYIFNKWSCWNSPSLCYSSCLASWRRCHFAQYCLKSTVLQTTQRDEKESSTQWIFQRWRWRWMKYLSPQNQNHSPDSGKFLLPLIWNPKSRPNHPFKGPISVYISFWSPL